MGVKEIFEEVMSPYVEGCRYLKSVEMDFPRSKGSFEIDRPFYCKPITGHFNAVETMICFNQLAYTTFGCFFNDGKWDHVGIIPLEEFKTLQAGSSYIARMADITFKKPINPHNFYGQIEVVKMPMRKNTLFGYLDFKFWDVEGGEASGKALLALSLEGKTRGKIQ